VNKTKSVAVFRCGLRTGERQVGGLVDFAIDFVLQLLQLVLAGDAFLHQQRAEPF